MRRYSYLDSKRDGNGVQSSHLLKRKPQHIDGHFVRVESLLWTALAKKADGSMLKD